MEGGGEIGVIRMDQLCSVLRDGITWRNCYRKNGWDVCTDGL